MRKQKKLSARVISLALTAAVACTMMPLNVLAITEGKSADDSEDIGIIRSFDDLEEPFIQSATDKYVYSLSVDLDTPFEDLDLPTELHAMVAHTSMVEKPEEETSVQKPTEAEPEEDITTEEETEAEPTEAEPTEEETAAPEESTEAEPTEEETEISMVSAFGTASDSLTISSMENRVFTDEADIESKSIAVTWKGVEAYHSDKNSRFIFTAELPEGYILAEDVKLPKIYVFVGKQARTLLLSDLGYSFAPDTGTLTITSNEGTSAWREDSSIVGVDEDGNEDYTKVKSVICTDDVTETQNRAFYGCKELTSVSMPNVTKLGDQTFSYCSFESIDLPKLTYIGSESISNCYVLKSVSFPLVTELADNAIKDCISLETASLPELTTAGGYIFIYCQKLEEISLPKLTTLGDMAFRGCSSLKKAELPQLTSLPEQTFYKCSSLESVVIPKVTSIEESAFEDCAKISSISLSQTPPALGKDALKNCSEKRSITLVDADGKALTGEALKTAQTAYKEDAGYSAETKLWNGFSLDTDPADNEGKRTKVLDLNASSIEKQADTTSWGDPTKESIDAMAAEGWAWDFTNKTLTLDGVDIAYSAPNASASAAIFMPYGLNTVLLKGSNKITSENTSAEGIKSNGSLVIKKAGGENSSLTIDSTSAAIHSMGSLEVKGVTISATSHEASAISTSGTGETTTISGTGTEVTAVSLSKGSGIYSSNVVISAGAKVSATSNPSSNEIFNYSGIRCITEGTITFSGTTTVVKSTGIRGALNKEPICNDGIVASGGTWESVNTEVTWKKPGGSSSGGSSSGGSSKDTIWKSVPANYNGGTKYIGNTIVPDYTVEGKWSQNANGGWSFTGNEGTKYAGTWVAAYNPYAVRGKGQNAFDWFVFDAAGNMLTGWFEDAEGNTYYLNQNSDNTLGAMHTGWVLINENYYYFNEMPDNTRGKLLRNTRTPDGYYIDENGVWDKNVQ